MYNFKHSIIKDITTRIGKNPTFVTVIYSIRHILTNYGYYHIIPKTPKEALRYYLDDFHYKLENKVSKHPQLAVYRSKKTLTQEEVEKTVKILFAPYLMRNNDGN